MVLADVFEVIVAIIMLFLGMAGWLGQQVKNKQQGAQPRPNRAKGDARVQDEIERFLQEVTGQKPAEKPRQPQDGGQRFDDDQRRRRQRADQNREAREQKQRREDYEREQDRIRREREVTAARRRQESQQASDRRSVANAPPQQRRPPKVKAKVASPKPAEDAVVVTPADILTPVARRPQGARQAIGATRQRGTMTAVSQSAAAAIGGQSAMPITLEELRDPAAIRKAIILQEIFAKPKSLRGDAAS